jgi:hypothetical protein
MNALPRFSPTKPGLGRFQKKHGKPCRVFFLLGTWLVTRGPYERRGRKRVILRYVSTNRGTSSEMTEHRVCRVAASGCGFLAGAASSCHIDDARRKST